MANVDIGGGNKLGKRVFIGTNATIIPQREVSDDARIGSGSIVLRNIKEAKTVFGNPAKTI
jgi:acetyltransferase-like isoleucine patch superfamily enzyme